MSDAIAGFVVTMDSSLSAEQAERLAGAMKFLNGVISVKPVVESIDIMLARERARHEFTQQIVETLRALR